MRFIPLLFFIGSLSHAADRAHFVSGLAGPDQLVDGFDFQSGSPVEFLSLLKATDGWISVDGFHHEWIHEEDVADLIPLMSSQESCAAVVSTLSSRIPTTESTVGREAALLIEGYRRGRYPSFLVSDHAHSTPQELRDLEQWCAEFQTYWKKRANRVPGTD